MGTEWACIKRDYEEIDELPLDDEFKVELFQRIYAYVITAGAFLRIHGKEKKGENSHS